MMGKALKIGLGVLAALVLLLAGVAAYLASRFDADAIKALAIERVQQDHQRTLAIPGALKLSFWPRLGLQLGEVTLSERGGKAPFAALKSAHVALAVMPLLQRQVVVDRIRIEGLSATLVRQADGKLNIDDLLGAPARPAGPSEGAATPAPVFDVAGLSLVDATLRLDDRQGHRQLELAQATLETGRLAPGQPTELQFKGRLKNSAPVTDLALDLSAKLQFDAAHVAASGVQLRAEGRLLDWPQSRLALKLAQFEQRAGTTQLQKIELDATLGGGAGHALTLKAQGQAQLRAKDAELQLGGSFEGSRFTLKAGVTDFQPLATRFELDVDQLDLDRWRPAQAAGTASAAAPAAEKPIDLAPLRELRTRGSLHVGALKVAGLQIADLRSTLNAAGGQAVLEPLQARLYQGRLAGKLVLQAQAVPRLALAQTLSEVQLGPLLKDMLGKTPIEGQGNVSLDVNAQGSTVSALRESLAGRAKLELRDGAVHGINIAQSVRNAKAKLGLAGGAQGGQSSAAERTDFSDLGASFEIHQGVAHNDDLQAHSPLLRVGGSGDVDLAHERLDYTVRATVVATLEGQGGPELQALNGQTIPVHLSGPFSAMSYKVDFASVLQDVARSKAGEKVKEQARDKLKDQLKGLLGR